MTTERIPILVVSDTHFGRGLPSQFSCRPEDFAKFLDWVLTDRTILLERPSWVQRKVSFPRKVILLGDILELWAPLKDRLVFERAYAAMAKLQEVGAKGCEIIYLAGNHDYTISEYEGLYGVTDAARIPTFRVVEDVYAYGRYVFLHGHQLIKEFRFPFWRLLGFVRGLVAAFGQILKLAIVILFFLTLFAWYFFGIDVLQISIVLGGLTALIIAREVAFPAWIVWKRLGKMAERLEAWLYGGMGEKRPQYREFAEIINDGSLKDWWNRYKEKSGEAPDVIVFGHTHRYDGPIRVENIPNVDSSETSRELSNRTLVNTGCWLKEEGEDCTSFLYITEEDDLLLCGYDPSRNIGVELPGEIARFASRQMPWSPSG